MKGFERDTIMYEKGQEAERKNTERERQRADFAEKEKIKAPKETTEALKRVAELEKIMQCKTTECKLDYLKIATDWHPSSLRLFHPLFLS